MKAPRLEQLQKFLDEEPGDVFTHYAIALEYVSMKKFPEAIEKFEGVITLDPWYVPAYHQLGVLYAQLQRYEEASAVLQKGVDAAHAAGDTHARQEMQEFIDELPV